MQHVKLQAISTRVINQLLRMHRRFQPVNSVCASSYCIKLVSDQQFHFSLGKLQTSWEQPKPAPYLRLKNSKRNSKCQSIGKLGTLLFLKKVERRVSQCPNKLKGGPYGIFQHPFCRKISKN